MANKPLENLTGGQPDERPATPREIFGQRLRETRTRLEISQARLAARVKDLGGDLQPTAITRIEKGTRDVSIDEATMLALALGVTLPAMLLPAPGPEVEVSLTPNVKADWYDTAAWYLGLALPPALLDFVEPSRSAWEELHGALETVRLFNELSTIEDLTYREMLRFQVDNQATRDELAESEPARAYSVVAGQLLELLRQLVALNVHPRRLNRREATAIMAYLRGLEGAQVQAEVPQEVRDLLSASFRNGIDPADTHWRHDD